MFRGFFPAERCSPERRNLAPFTQLTENLRTPLDPFWGMWWFGSLYPLALVAHKTAALPPRTSHRLSRRRALSHRASSRHAESVRYKAAAKCPHRHPCSHPPSSLSPCMMPAVPQRLAVVAWPRASRRQARDSRPVARASGSRGRVSRGLGACEAGAGACEPTLGACEGTPGPVRVHPWRVSAAPWSASIAPWVRAS